MELITVYWLHCSQCWCYIITSIHVCASILDSCITKTTVRNTKRDTKIIGSNRWREALTNETNLFYNQILVIRFQFLPYVIELKLQKRRKLGWCHSFPFIILERPIWTIYIGKMYPSVSRTSRFCDIIQLPVISSYSDINQFQFKAFTLWLCLPIEI